MSYFDRPEYSRTDITYIADGRSRDFHAYKIAKTLEIDESDEMLIGSVTHGLLLEPDVLTRIVVPPDEVLSEDSNGVKRRVGKLYKEWVAQNPGLISMLPAHMDVSIKAANALRKEIGHLIDHPHAMREKEIYWTHEKTGLPLRAKLDLIVPTDIGTFIPDVKTTHDIARFCRYEIEDRHLYLQHAMYRDAVKHRFGTDATFFFVTVEKKGMYRCRAIPLDDDAAAFADEAYDKTLEQLKLRLDADDWSEPGEGALEENTVGISTYFQQKVLNRLKKIKSEKFTQPDGNDDEQRYYYPAE